MRIGFWINRLSSFKTMGTVIEMALTDDEVTLYYDDRASKIPGAKSYLAPVPQKFPTFSTGTPRLVPCSGPQDLVRQTKEDRLDAFVLHQGYHFCKSEP